MLFHTYLQVKESKGAIVDDGIVQCSLQKAIDVIMSNDEYSEHYTELKQLVCTGEISNANTAK